MKNEPELGLNIANQYVMNIINRGVILFIIFGVTMPVLAVDTCRALFVTSITNFYPVDRLEYFDAKFKNDLGITPVKLLQLYKKNNPEAQPIFTRLQKDDYSIALMIPQIYLAKILAEGIKNLHETKQGGGIEDLTIRTAVELSLSQLTEKQFYELPDKRKPKYAMLWPEIKSSLKNDHIPRFGDIALILKKEKLKNHMTWSPLDSFDLIRDQYFESLVAGQVISASKLNWYQQFIPMNRIELAVLFIHAFDKVEMSSKSRNRSFMPKEMELGPLNGMTLFFNPPRRANSYIEFQIWSEIKSTDVEAIVFLGEPPSVEVIEKLEDLTIKVYDGRSGYRIPWAK